MKVIVKKRTMRNSKGQVMLQPFFGRKLVIVYRPDVEISDGEYVVNFNKHLIPAGKDKNGKPIFIRKCSVLKRLQ